MLIQGENTYVTAVEADEYTNTYYAEYTPIRVIWSVLNEEEKETYLRNSLTEMEALPFVGRKSRNEQKLSFPRVKNGTGIYCAYPYGAFYGGIVNGSKIPQEVKHAQIENALAIISKECMAQTDKQFMIMQSLGAMKNIKYNKREAGDIGMGDDIKGGGNNNGFGLTSKTAQSMLRGWLGTLRV